MSVGLVAPYLAYMRQDKRFQPGETISAQHVAAWIPATSICLTRTERHRTIESFTAGSTNNAAPLWMSAERKLDFRQNARRF